MKVPLAVGDFLQRAEAVRPYNSGTSARPKGVQLTHRSCWLNAVSFGWHSTVTDRDVLLHTLPMFHVNGWGMPYGLTAMGGPDGKWGETVEIRPALERTATGKLQKFTLREPYWRDLDREVN